MIDRRALLTALGAALATGACSRTPASSGSVLAAGQPAALLIHALAPRRLIGWPRKPSADALAFLPPAAAALPETGALAGGGAPMSLEAAAALRPDFILDYGDRDTTDLDLADRIRSRTGRPYHLIDGALMRTPDAFREAGRLLGVTQRGEHLAAMAERLINVWQTPRRAGPTFYYARGADGLETAFKGALATEVLEGSGWRNVAVGGRDIGRVSREQVVAWDPEVVVTLDRRFAKAAADDPVWRNRPDGARRRLLLLPDRPFGWIDRPPSVNRLLGVDWATFGDPNPVDALAIRREIQGFIPTVATLMGELYNRVPDATELAALAPLDIA